MHQLSFRLTAQRGSATLEFAALTVVLVTLMLLGVDYARMMVQYDTLVKSARAAARYASTQASTASTAPAKCLAVFGNTACTGTAVVPGLSTSNVAVAYGVFDGSTNKVTATISGLAYQAGFSALAISITFEPISAVMTQPN